MEIVQQNTLIDVEMSVLRRSTRVVSKPQRINYEHPVKRKGERKVKVKSNTRSRSKSKTKTQAKPKAKTARKRMKTFIDKFADLRKTKISDMFCLVNKHVLNEEEKQQKYLVLQIILKGMKDNEIKNTLTDLYTHKHKLASYIVMKQLSTSSPLCFTNVNQHIDDMLSYKEVDGIDMIHTNTIETQDTSNMMDTSSVLQDGIDALDELQSIFRRLIV